jgi:hypothetical protein
MGQGVRFHKKGNHMTPSIHKSNRLWWLAWAAAFLGFPPGGALATAVIGRLDTPIEGVIGGALAGVVIGSAGYLALRLLIPIRLTWIVATTVGLAAGVGAGVLLFGSDTSLNATLLRAPLAGLLMGAAQAWVLRGHLRHAWVWALAHTLLHPLAWWITAQVIGQNMDIGFVVFGASGALFYQLALGVVLHFMSRAGATTTP